jgi:hypothetical protein
VKDELVRCTECERTITGDLAADERWTYWSDGIDLNPYCPECAEREFAPDAPADFSSPELEARRVG